METIDTKAVQIILQKIENGIIFEDFAKLFFAAITEGTIFVPIGGTQDNGIDGMDYAWTVHKKVNKTIYQFSIEQDGQSKIRKTLNRLSQTVPDCGRLIYATNKIIKKQNEIIDEAYEKFNVALQIHDLQWFIVHVNESPKTVSIFREMEKQHFHAYERSNTIISQFDSKDPRIYIYLRQQIENKYNDYGNGEETHLDEILMDSLILLALEGTDPDQNILRSQQEIRERILEITDFKVQWINELLPKRLKTLSTKPRKIKHHKGNGYCLPYETRSEIDERNIVDEALMHHFRESASEILQTGLQNEGLDVKIIEPVELMMAVLHELFRQQGLEFSQFLATGDRNFFTDRLLNEVLKEKIATSRIAPKYREAIHGIILDCFRQIIYQGDTDQKEFLRRLSNTYNMLFLLQIEPTLVRYFERIAGELRIYVDSSILIPAMAEYFLEPHNQRYTNLLRSAKDAGIRIIVNNYVLSEMESHLRNIKRIFKREYERYEERFSDHMTIIFIDEILIRAYFYSKFNSKINSFREYIENFLSWNMNGDIRGELVLWLEDQFGVMYEELDIDLDHYEIEELTQALKPLKRDGNEKRARTDAKQLLTIYKLRKENEETSQTGIFGYKTWWLTSDVTSQKAFMQVAEKSERGASPYIRADYIYNYIALAPSQRHVDNIYKQMFPTLLGVNVSFYVPDEIASYIRKLLREFDEIVNKPRFRAKMREFIHYLKSHPDQMDRNTLTNFYDELKREAESYYPHAM